MTAPMPDDDSILDDPTLLADPDPGRSIELQPRDRIDHYQVVELLGAGGMGRVYRVRDLQLDRALALKVLRAGSMAGNEERARFQREARSAARLRHPGIVTIHGFGFDRGFAYFTMDLVEGPTLARRIERGPLPADEAVRIAGAVARAIQYAHDHGVLHRDLKPSNILLAEGQSPRLTDFGLACATGDEDATRLTRSGMILGTPAYMAPEQATGDLARIGPRTDVYGLGVLLYEMLTGTVPFGSDAPVSVVQRILHEDPPPPRRHRPGLSRELEAICLKAMARDPRDRYATAADLAEDLWRFEHGHETVARPLSPAGRLVRSYRRRRTAWWTAALLLALNLFYVGWLNAARLELAARNEELERRDRQRSAIELAQKASREGDPAVAAARFGEARALAFEPFEVVRLEGQYHQRHGRYDEAIAAYEEALGLGRAAGVDRELLAIVLFDLYWCHADRNRTFPLQDTEAMRALLDEIARLDPDDPLVLFARSRLVEGDRAAAIELLDRAIAASDVPFWQARGMRAQFLAESGRMEDALADLDEAIRVAPDEPLLLGFRGWFHLYRLAAPPAFDDFDRALRASQLAPFERTYLLLGRGLSALLLDRHDRSAEDLLAALADEATVRQLLAYTLYVFPQIGQAASFALEQKIRAEPDRPHLRALRGVFRSILARTARPEARGTLVQQALADFDEAERLSDDYGSVLAPYRRTLPR